MCLCYIRNSCSKYYLLVCLVTLRLLFPLEDPTREIDVEELPPAFRAMRMEPVPQPPSPPPPQLIPWQAVKSMLLWSEEIKNFRMEESMMRDIPG